MFHTKIEHVSFEKLRVAVTINKTDITSYITFLYKIKFI
jgi:hypothetical protein